MTEDILMCDLCSEKITTRVLQKCGHNDICLNCYLRYVKNYGGTSCYYCQAAIEDKPIATSNLELSYDDAQKLELIYDEANSLFYTDKKVSKALKKSNEYHCKDCHHNFKELHAFSKHLENHGKELCRICMSSGRYAPNSVEVFTHNQIKNHIHQHHPRCQCCKKLFFDQNTLSKHMIESHHRCEICAKNDVILWLNTMEELIEHNEKEHFICHHQSCACLGLVAFPTRGELLLHLQRVHKDFDVEIDFERDFNDKKTVKHQQMNQKSEIERICMKKVWQILNSKKRVDEFCAARHDLVQKKLTPTEFYKVFAKIFGENKNAIFCDFAAALRDPKLRMELFMIHNGIDTANSQQKSNKDPKINHIPPQIQETEEVQKIEIIKKSPSRGKKKRTVILAF